MVDAWFPALTKSLVLPFSQLLCKQGPCLHQALHIYIYIYYIYTYRYSTWWPGPVVRRCSRSCSKRRNGGCLCIEWELIKHALFLWSVATALFHQHNCKEGIRWWSEQRDCAILLKKNVTGIAVSVRECYGLHGGQA